MRSLCIITALFLSISLCFGQKEQIVEKSYPDGTPSLVIHLSAKGQKTKEVSYFKNGQMEYEGTFKDEREHGKWTYYFENGQKKFEEYYKDGLEEGKHYEWDLDGQLSKTEIYKKGRLIKTIE